MQLLYNTIFSQTSAHFLPHPPPPLPPPPRSLSSKVRKSKGKPLFRLDRSHFLSLIILVGGILSYKRLMWMCRWMASHFHDWIDCDGVAFSINLLEWGRSFPDFLGLRQFFIFTVSKRTSMFVL